MNNIRILSLFSGCGGLDLGFEQVGDYKTIWANDFKHEACVTFEKHFGKVIVEGDVEKIDPYNNEQVPDCDLILGGFPLTFSATNAFGFLASTNLKKLLYKFPLSPFRPGCCILMRSSGQNSRTAARICRCCSTVHILFVPAYHPPL